MDSVLYSGKLFTVEEARKTLPLVSAIVGDIVTLASDLRDRHERLRSFRSRTEKSDEDSVNPYREEVEEVKRDLARDEERLQEYVQELSQLGVELKDFERGLIDFPHELDGRVVYLCWQLGEEDLGFWHELDAGFAGRRPLWDEQVSGDDPLVTDVNDK